MKKGNKRRPHKPAPPPKKQSTQNYAVSTKGSSVVGAAPPSTFRTAIQLPMVSWSSFPYLWIPFDRDNLFPDRVSTWKTSPVHGACLLTKSTILYGTGLEYDETATNNFYPNPLEPYLSPEQNSGLGLGMELNNLLFWGDDCNLTLAEFIRRIVYDFIVHNTYAFKVKCRPERTKNGLLHYKIYGLDYVDPAQLRLAAPDFGNGETTPKNVYWCRDWQQPYMPINQLTKYDLFTGLEHSFCSDEAIFYYTGRIEGSNWYPLPEYVGIINDIQSDYEISVFRLKMTKNNMSVQTVVTLPSQPATEEEKAALELSLRAQTGNHSEHNMLIVYSENNLSGGVNAPKVEMLNMTDTGKTFETLDSSIVKRILMTHRVPEALSMLGENTGLITNTDGTLNATAVFEHYVINPIKDLPLEGLKRVLRYNLWGEPTINSLELGRIDLPTILARKAAL